MHNDKEFYDIFDYYEPSFWQTIWFKVALVLLIILVAALILFFIFKKKKKNIESWQWAEQKIAQLALEKCTERTDYKRFYFELTTIIKQYLNRRYGWKTEDKTDEELSEYLSKQGLHATICDSLKKMLLGATWIKFAGENVIKTQAEADLKTALMLIKETIPSEQKNK